MKAQTEIRVREAVHKANRMRAARSASHVAVFADVLIDNVKVGHIVSDGYTHDHWSFHPLDKKRMRRDRKPLDEVLPKWASGKNSHLADFENSIEMLDKHEAKQKIERRAKMLADPAYTAFDSESFPCNPIPFANALADHVREFGTDSIKSDQAKAILWILMGQAYGQLAKIDMCDEWDRLSKLKDLKAAQDKLHPADNGHAIIEDAISEVQS